MATVQDHLTCNGFDVWVLVDGAKATAYSVESNEGKQQTSCWISSAADKEFTISFHRKELDEYDYSAEVLLDGHLVANFIYMNELGASSKINKISWSRVSSTEIRNFAFGPLELTDDDIHLGDPSTQNIGEIKVIIKRAKAIGLCPVQNPSIYGLPTMGKVHERSKKGLAHHVKYGPTQKNIVASTRYATTSYGEPMTFIFKYRPFEMLQAMGIAPAPPLPSLSHEQQVTPRSTSPTSETNKRTISAVKIEDSDDDDESDAEDDEDMIAKERELLAELERVRNKQRSKKEGGRPKKKPKMEPKTYFIPGEVIDLT